jgi:Ser/Thr protein kinase RdoA (MazF antagonist)
VASDFPYEAPRLLVTNAGADYVRDGEWQWLLYPFIEGHDAPDPGSEDQARDIGALVAHYHRAMRGFEPVETERRFVLDTFQRNHIDATFAESAGPLRGQEAAADLAEEYLAHRKTILDAHQNLDPLELARVNDLEKTTIYYDWHRYNMVARAGRIVGLIDYDSVIEAPRIVDVQNALTYIIIGDDEPSWDLVAAFAEGYGSVERLSIDEARLVPTLMRDQATWLVADVVTEIRAQGASPRARLAIQLIHLLTRLDENAAALVADLADPSRSVPEDVS